MFQLIRDYRNLFIVSNDSMTPLDFDTDKRDEET